MRWKVSLKTDMYIFFVCMSALLMSVLFINTKFVPLKTTNISNIIFFSIVIMLTETLSMKLNGFSYSASFAVTFAVYILFGPLSTLLILSLGFLFRVLKIDNRYVHFFNTPFYKTLFNLSSMAIQVFLANYIYMLLKFSNHGSNVYLEFIDLGAFCSIYFILNCVIMAGLFAFIKNKGFFYSFVNNFKLEVLNIIIMAPFGVIVSAAYNAYGKFAAAFALFPIMLARYTFSLYAKTKSEYTQIVDVLMHAVEARDKYTEGHSERVALLSKKIAKELKYNDSKIDEINMAALLHDIGKIGIDDHILNKKGRLTKEEFDVIKKHPEIGCNILNGIKDIKNVSFIVKHHHERYDGKGYPSGMNADKLNMEVFIIQLADCIDAMATDRPYRKALSYDEVINEVKQNSGTQFHPKVVQAYLKIVERTKDVFGKES